METESVILDDVDRAVLHALTIDGRASFARIGDVLHVSDRTIARRFTRMRAADVFRLIGAADPTQLGGAQWFIRIHYKPGSTTQIAAALARREDIRWVRVLSGGTEICASLQSWSPQERDELLLQRLQRTSAVVSMTAHSVLHTYLGGPAGFAGLRCLDPDQETALRHRHQSTGPVVLEDADRPLLEALARDGRAPNPVLAAVTRWSESTVGRRIEALRGAGILYFDVDIDTRALGYHAEAQLWASVAPSALADTGAAIAKHPEVAFCAATTGTTNLLIAVVCRDYDDLYRYLSERLGALPAVHSVETAPVMQTVKRAGAAPT